MLPLGYTRISEAVNVLEEGMFAGLPRPEVLRRIDPKRRASIGFGARREKAASIIRDVAVSGAISIYVARPSDNTICTLSPMDVASIIPVRGGIPVAGWCYTQSEGEISSENILGAMLGGEILLRIDDFATWYNQERSRGIWPSQQRRKRRGRGRPRQASEALRAEIIALTKNGQWQRSDGIPVLASALSQCPHVPALSEDTLKREVDRLFLETGIPELTLQSSRKVQSF